MQNNSDRWLQDNDEHNRHNRSSMFRKVFAPNQKIPANEETSSSQQESPCIDAGIRGKVYDTLRESIYHIGDTTGTIPHMMAVTSCYRGEGVSTVAVNLARAFTRDGNVKVLLADANYRTPTLHKTFGIDSSPGLSDIIENRIEPSHVIKQSGKDNLFFLPAGECHYQPDQKYGTREFAELLDSLKNEYGFVLFDTPPLEGNELSAVKLGGLVDGVILVIEAERVRWEVVQHARDRLTQGNVDILGAVLNKRQYHVPRWLYKTL